MKKLLVSSTDLMMVQFLVPHIKSLSTQGYEIDLACSDVGGRMNEVKEILGPFTKNIFELSLQRSPLSPRNIKGLKELKTILKNNQYDLIWTNEPVMGVITRLTANKYRKKGTKVIYMAHGFHFFKGAPMLNWMIFYPIERIMAGKTDLIVTVNHEDFKRAKSFYPKKKERVKYVHGIGINTERLTKDREKRNSIRKELGLSENDFIILSVGELNDNKNQTTILKALSVSGNRNIHYILCGKGAKESYLKNLATELGIDDRVHFLGYRKDVVDICSEANVYAMPSFREGLPVSSLEAMYCGLPLITSNIRGLNDVNHDGKNGFLCSPSKYKDFAFYINLLYIDSDIRKKMGEQNKIDVQPYILQNTLKEVKEIIDSVRG